jgi:L-lactate dehydrogenase complex protein LldG
VSGDRERFMQCVRQAVVEGNRAGVAAPIPERGEVGYQGAGVDPKSRFCAELTAAGGQPHVVPDKQAAVALLLSLARERGARRVLLGHEPILAGLHLADALHNAGVDVVRVETLTEGQQREPFFAADLAVTGVDYLIGETGSVVLRTQPDQPRSLSLLPPIHIAIASPQQIIPDLFDLFEKRLGPDKDGLPACLSIITGPSKTGDIELRLVTGVHGPGEIHVVLIEA